MSNLVSTKKQQCASERLPLLIAGEVCSCRVEADLESHLQSGYSSD